MGRWDGLWRLLVVTCEDMRRDNTSGGINHRHFISDATTIKSLTGHLQGPGRDTVSSAKCQIKCRVKLLTEKLNQEREEAITMGVKLADF